MNLKIKCTKCIVKVKALGVCFFETLVLICIIKPLNFPEESSEQQDSKKSKEYTAGRAHIENLMKSFLILEHFSCYISLLRRVRKIAKSGYEFRHVRPSARNDSAPSGKILMKFDVWEYFENLLRKFKLHSNLTRIMCTLHLDQYTFFVTSRSFLLTIRNVSDKF